MPIYEFYCADCHTVFSFLARKPDSRKRPACPRCDSRNMQRKASAFSIAKGLTEPAAGDELPGGDDDRLERLMAELAQEAETVNEEDPRQMARMMRKLFDGTGMPMGAGIEEAIRRMEAGEDPDKIEEELGDLLDGEDGALTAATNGGGARLKRLRRKLTAPSVDKTLYEL